MTNDFFLFHKVNEVTVQITDFKTKTESNSQTTTKAMSPLVVKMERETWVLRRVNIFEMIPEII